MTTATETAREVEITVVSPGPFKARSASDKTDDWPYWYVAGGDGRTNAVRFGGALFAPRALAELVAATLRDQRAGETGGQGEGR